MNTIIVKNIKTSDHKTDAISNFLDEKIEHAIFKISTNIKEISLLELMMHKKESEMNHYLHENLKELVSGMKSIIAEISQRRQKRNIAENYLNLM